MSYSMQLSQPITLRNTFTIHIIHTMFHDDVLLLILVEVLIMTACIYEWRCRSVTGLVCIHPFLFMEHALPFQILMGKSIS